MLLVGAVAWVALAAGTSSVAAEADHDTSWPVAAAPGAAQKAAQAARAGGSQVIRVKEIEVRGRFIDVGSQGDGPGDYFVSESKLMQDGQKVGRDSVRCTFGVRTFSCEATALIKGKGKIAVAGALFTDQNDFHLPITGGTGAFKDARGGLTVEEGKKTFLVFELLPR